jgi:hypothetical protein
MKLKLKFTLLLIFALTSKCVFSVTYSFTGSSPSDSVNGTFQNVIIPVWNQDNFDTLLHPFAFNFYLDGINYTGIIVSANGWVALVNSITSYMPPYFASGLPNNSLSTYAGGLPLFAPLWDDHSANYISTQFVNNKLTVRWSIKWDKNYSGNFSNLIWIIFDCTTGIVTFNYSNAIYTPSNTVSASIGIAGLCNGQFYSVTPDNIPANSAVSTTAEDSLVTYKPYDAKYTWSPVANPPLSWTGSADTLYDNGTNWGSCLSPDCLTDATIDTTPSGNMPTVRSNQSVRNLTIMPGATLHILAPNTLSVCGNFNNNGRLIADPGSAINFTGSGNQHVSGLLTDSNSFANMSISKSSGQLILMTDIDVMNNLSGAVTTDTFNMNGMHVRLAGDFNLKNIIDFGGSILEFIGGNNQMFTTDNSHLTHVIVNKIAGNIYLHSNMIIDTLLSLIKGNIATSAGYEVSILLNNALAMQNYSRDSYIDGRLRRKLWLGDIEFPVGDSLVPNQGNDKGYELATIAFTSSTVISDLVAWFNIWPLASPPSGPVNPDICLIDSVSYHTSPLYDNGYWAFEKNSATYNGAYNVLLYNTGGSNLSTGGFWTVATAPLIFNPALSSSWTIYGDCSPTSTLQQTKRDSLNNPADPNESFNLYYVTAQGSWLGQVPVNEIEKNSELYIKNNPITDISDLKINSGISEEVNFQLTTPEGQILCKQKIKLKPGEFSIPGIKSLSTGLYLINISNQTRICNLKLLIQ